MRPNARALRSARHARSVCPGTREQRVRLVGRDPPGGRRHSGAAPYPQCGFAAREGTNTGVLWSGCRDSNPGPSVPQTDALTKLRHSPQAGEPTGRRARSAVRDPHDPLIEPVQEIDGDTSREHLQMPRHRRQVFLGRRAGIAHPQLRRVAVSVSTVASTPRPQVGQVPSARTVDGERNRSHVVHQGTLSTPRPRPAGRRGAGGSLRASGCGPTRTG